VPLNRLIYTSPRQNPLDSSLTRTDFDSAQPTNYGMQAGLAAAASSNSRPPMSTETTPLSPTGRTPEPTGYTSTQAITTSTDAPVQAVREAFRADPSLAVERIDVTTENGRIVLRGTVRDQATKDSLERAARRAVPTMPIETDLLVEPR
jgi:hypothetical protein